MGIDSDLIRGHVDTIILKTLTSGDKYGYEIIKEVEEKSGGTYVLKQPTLYSCLNRMEGKGLISSYWLDSDIGGRRHYYKLEESGKLAIEENQRDWIRGRKIIDNLISNISQSESFTPPSSALDESLVPSANIQQTSKENSESERNETLSSDSKNAVEEVLEANIALDNDSKTKSNEYEKSETSELKQTDLFESLLKPEDNMESFDVDDVQDTIIEGFFEISNAKIAEAEHLEDVQNVVKEFDVSSYYTTTSPSFFDAYKDGSAVKPDYIPSTKPFESVTDDDEDFDSVNFVENATETSALEKTFDSHFEQNIDNEDITDVDSQLDKTNNTEETSLNVQEEDEYFNIKLEDEDSSSNTQEDSLVASNESNHNEEIQPDHNFSFERIEPEADVVSSLDTFESVMKETASSIENENRILYERLENIKTYTPKYTDAEYKNILGGLTAYSNTSKLKPKYNEPNMTSESKLVKDFGETRQILEREGINVKINTRRERENPETRTYILTNKIKMVSSWIVFFFMLSLLAITYIVGSKVGYVSREFSSSTIYFLVALVVLLVFPITNSVIFYSNPMKKHIPKYAPRASFLFALLFFLQCLVLVYAINLPFGFYSFSQIDYNHLNWLIPSVTSIVFLASSVVYSILFLSKRFHV